eukprot:NODE_10017_length_1382_cov_10.604781.p1 GENE.NODE_10017_length_1382_cov_10.604781~~NODE_10017_length_1382_cov_10.604781.p1  ORF type:complete len:345 (+),score=71.25 NODE_10017_length_1382_cov_10.604781:75-1109(+)
MTMKLGSRPTCARVADAFLKGGNLDNSTVIITGCNTGLGLPAVGALAACGATVVMACRSIAKAEAAANDERKRLGKELKTIHCLALDLASVASITAFVAEFREVSRKRGFPPLDRIICNANFSGNADHSETGFGPREFTEDTKCQVHFAVGHLGHHLLVKSLLPELRAGAAQNGGARIVMVASESYKDPVIKDMEDRNAVLKQVARPEAKDWETFFETVKFYGSVKLCNVLFAIGLTSREKDNGIRACSLHPGTMVYTASVKRLPRYGAAYCCLAGIVRCYAPCNKSMDQAAATTVYASLLPHGQLRGQFLNCCKEQKLEKFVTDKAADTLWAVTEEILGEEKR